MQRRTVVAAIACVTLAGLTTACGGSSGGGGGSGGSGGASGSSGGGGRGPITYVQGKDNNNILPTIEQMWNQDHPNEKVTIKQQSDSADDQHQDLVQHFQAKDSSYDVASVDVVWTAEFAAKGWLTPLKGQYQLDTSQLFQPTVKSATYNGTLFAGPASSDGGLLYYRKDLAPTPPKTWQEMYQMCSIAQQNNIDCYGGQYAQYEGLVVNTAEAINTAGGEIVNDQGQPTVNTQQAQNGMNLLVTGFQKGYIPKSALTWKEEQSLNDFESGHLMFLRNWPYAFSLLSTDAKSAVQGKFGVTTLPGDQQDPGGKMPGVSSLGGHNMAISAFSKNKATALDFIKFMESEATQKLLLQKASLAPVRTSLYDDQSLQQQFPYLSTLKTVIENAQPRPVTPYYPAVSQAIEQNSYAILQGQVSVQQGLQNLQDAIKAASK